LNDEELRFWQQKQIQEIDALRARIEALESRPPPAAARLRDRAGNLGTDVTYVARVAGLRMALLNVFAAALLGGAGLYAGYAFSLAANAYESDLNRTRAENVQLRNMLSQKQPPCTNARPGTGSTTL
jgi:hypothetical protein